MPRSTPTINEVTDPGNFERAWRWIKSNPDRRYKGYFRSSYGDYTIIENEFLKDLAKRVKDRTYEPGHCCKIFIPKSSGILRPYTLLSVEDQIVYQGMVNIIAEHLYPHVKSSYLTSTYGNLYAGKSSPWFYRKWSSCYTEFNNAARKAFDSGLKYTASFDLVACYDSLDHKVLRHFLKDIKCDDEFIDLLIKCLSKWTGTEKSKIYHNHGIPQGPLASGLLSEVVLRYFDFKYKNQPNMKYMRYVDDIRLFAKSENDLRRMLVRLDRLSKDIGLFPQSSKIEIHEVKNIEEEIKSISNPTESSVGSKVVNQNKLQARIKKISERYKIENPTRFKYLLAHATPSSKLNDRVWKIYKQQISYSESVFRYFQKYEYLPHTVFQNLFQELKSKNIYAMVTSELVDTLHGRLKGKDQEDFHKFIKTLWTPKTLMSEISLHASLIKVIVENNLINESRLKYAFASAEWYVGTQAVKSLSKETISPLLLSNLLNQKIRDHSNDVACAAAVMMVRYGVKVDRPLSTINRYAAWILKSTGKIGKIPSGTRPCNVNIHINKWMSNKITGMDWRSVFGSRYSQAENLAFNCLLKAGTDTTAWVNAMDVFNDLLLDCLFKHDTTIGGYSYGNIGGAEFNTQFIAKYPHLHAMTTSIHQQRLNSHLSHAVNRKTNKATGPIKYRYYKTEARNLIKKAFDELAMKW